MHKNPAILESRHLAAWPRIRSGESLSAIARDLGVTRHAVHRWKLLGRRHGTEGLLRGRVPGLGFLKLSRAQRA